VRTLVLVRHVTSSWNDPTLPDTNRPLNDRGKRDARRLGKRLAKRQVKPDVILSSPARRAVATVRIVARKLDCRVRDIQVNDRLYAVEADVLLHVIRGLGSKPKSVMLFTPRQSQSADAVAQ
jgi:phosphohistidine phosphatase